jgi:predicted  nucleic acid-binding Zn-ribbon protein
MVSSLTNFALRDALILRGPCPNCGTNVNTYFGDILTVQGNREKNSVGCGNCKAKLEFDALDRTIKVLEMPGEKKEKSNKPAPKKDGGSGGPAAKKPAPKKEPATAGKA